MELQLLRRALFGFSVLALTASACASREGIPPTESTPVSTTGAVTATTAAPRSVYGGTLVVGVADGGAPRTLNPLLESPDAAVLDMLAPALFAQAYDVEPSSGARVPDVFVAVPSIEDGTIVDNGDGTLDVTVEIVDGASWADGAPITGADLEFTYELATNPDLPIRPDVARLYGSVTSGSTRARGRSLTFRMDAGTDPADLFSIIVPRHAVETSDFGRDWTDRVWVSGGPFVLGDWQPGRFVELKRNEGYWKVTRAEGAPLPFLDRLVVRFYEPGESLDPRLVDGFERGEVAVAVFNGAESRRTEFAPAEADGAAVDVMPNGQWEHLNFQFGPGNRNGTSQNGSAAFRRAVAHAIDRPFLARQRGTEVVDSILEQFVPGLGDSPFAVYDLDPEAVTAAVGDDAPRIVLTVPEQDADTVALAGDLVTMLLDAGFEAELQLEDSSLFFGPTLDGGSWDVSAWRFGAGSGLGDAVRFFDFYDPAGLPPVGVNFFRWGTLDSGVGDGATGRYREIVSALDAAVDPEAIAELLIEAEQILADETVLLPLIVAGEAGVAHWPGAVTGVDLNPVQGILWNVDVWRVPTE